MPPRFRLCTPVISKGLCRRARQVPRFNDFPRERADRDTFVNALRLESLVPSVHGSRHVGAGVYEVRKLARDRPTCQHPKRPSFRRRRLRLPSSVPTATSDMALTPSRPSPPGSEHPQPPVRLAGVAAARPGAPPLPGLPAVPPPSSSSPGPEAIPEAAPVGGGPPPRPRRRHVQNPRPSRHRRHWHRYGLRRAFFQRCGECRSVTRVGGLLKLRASASLEWCSRRRCQLNRAGCAGWIRYRAATPDFFRNAARPAMERDCGER